MSCSEVCSGSVAGRNSRSPETDVGPSVPKPAARQAESPFLVEVQEYRGLRIAVERLFRGLSTGYTRESWKSQPRPLLARHGPYLTARHPLCRCADVPEGHRVLAGVNYPERSEERARPGAVESPGTPGSSPVERADRRGTARVFGPTGSCGDGTSCRATEGSPA